MKSRFSVSRAWEESKSHLAADGRLLTTVALALILLPQALAGAVAPPPELSGQEPPGWTAVLMLAAALLGLVAQIAIIRLALQSAVSVGEAIGHGARRMPVLLLAIILIMVLLLVAMVPVVILLALAGVVPPPNMAPSPASAALVAGLLVIAFLAVSPKFQLVVPVASAEPAGPITLLKRSWKLSNGHYWQLLGFVLLLLVGGMILILPAQLIAGVIVRLLFGTAEPLSIGALIFALVGAAAQTAFVLIASLMLARIYAQLAGEERLEASVPTTGS